jgi:hypothetical protein
MLNELIKWAEPICWIVLSVAAIVYTTVTMLRQKK